jgi:hypothetical protein
MLPLIAGVVAQVHTDRRCEVTEEIDRIEEDQ